jgi:hypothetical protein
LIDDRQQIEFCHEKLQKKVWRKIPFGRKTRRSIEIGTNKKAPKAEKRIIYFSALGTFANFRHLLF